MIATGRGRFPRRGFSPPALRAALMGALPLLALFFGRTRNAHRFFFLSGASLIFYNPWLVFDYGFLLSFSATFGLLFIAPIFQKYFPNPNFFVEILLLTISVQLSSLPILFSFGNFSLISPLTNMIFLPFLPFFLLAGVVAFLVSFFAPIFSLCVDVFLVALHFFAKIPFASVEVPGFSWFWMAAYYSAVLWFVRRFNT